MVSSQNIFTKIERLMQIASNNIISHNILHIMKITKIHWNFIKVQLSFMLSQTNELTYRYITTLI